MASMAPAGGPCDDRKRLFYEFKSANQQLIRIHAKEIQAAVDENPDGVLALSDELREWRKRRDTAAEELKRHIREHRC